MKVKLFVYLELKLKTGTEFQISWVLWVLLVNTLISALKSHWVVGNYSSDYESILNTLNTYVLSVMNRVWVAFNVNEYDKISGINLFVYL